MNNDHLLPPSASPLMRASAQGRVSDIDVPIADLWDVDRCPIALLPYLAFAMSVDEWDSDWPDDVQRDVIRNSIAVHRIKGTPGAIKQALAGIGLDVDLLEWWQQKPRAAVYTHVINVYANRNLYPGSPLVNPHLDKIARRVIDSVARASQHYQMRLGVKLNQSLRAAGASRGVSLTRAAGVVAGPTLRGGLTTAAAARGATIARCRMVA